MTKSSQDDVVTVFCSPKVKRKLNASHHDCYCSQKALELVFVFVKRDDGLLEQSSLNSFSPQEQPRL